MREKKDATILERIKQNYKIEAIILTCFIIVSVIRIIAFFIGWDKTTVWEQIRSTGIIIFNPDRLNLFAGFFSIICGIYLAVITIIGTSIIGITKGLLKQKLDRDLINLFMIGLIENIISVITCIIAAGVSGVYFYCTLIVVFLLTFVTLIKFILIIRLIFLANLEKTAKSIDEDEYYKQQLLNTIYGIERNTKQVRTDNEM